MMIPVFVATVLLFSGVIARPEVRDDTIGCFLPGECLKSNFVNVTNVDTLQECHNGCKEQEVLKRTALLYLMTCIHLAYTQGCDHFTHYESSGTCFLYSNCIEYSDEGCKDDCISGDVGCQDLKYESSYSISIETKQPHGYLFSGATWEVDVMEPLKHFTQMSSSSGIVSSIAENMVIDASTGPWILTLVFVL